MAAVKTVSRVAVQKGSRAIEDDGRRSGNQCRVSHFYRGADFFKTKFLTALRAGPPFSWGVTSGGPPGGRSLSKDGTRAESAKDF